MRKKVTLRPSSFKRERDAFMEREASICPEDVGYNKYIHTLQQQLAAARVALVKIENYQYHAWTTETPKQMIQIAQAALAECGGK